MLAVRQPRRARTPRTSRTFVALIPHGVTTITIIVKNKICRVCARTWQIEYQRTWPELKSAEPTDTHTCVCARVLFTHINIDRCPPRHGGQFVQKTRLTERSRARSDAIYLLHDRVASGIDRTVCVCVWKLCERTFPVGVCARVHMSFVRK